DATRCLSYMTIEQTAPHDELYRAHNDGWWFGCDACQQVCPWNRFDSPTTDEFFAPSDSLRTLTPTEFAALSADAFRERFRRTPLWRPGHASLTAALSILTHTNDY